MESAAANRLEKRSRIARRRRRSAAFRARSLAIGAKPAPFRVIPEPRRGVLGSYIWTEFVTQAFESARAAPGICAAAEPR
jgi:hypothetical protein